MNRQDPLQAVFENPGPYGCAWLQQDTMLDGGIAAPGGWKAGRLLVQSLLGGFAEVTFDQMTAGGRLVPTLDVYLDNTVAAARALDFSAAVVRGEGAAYGFAQTEDKTARFEGRVLAASPTSLVGHLFEAGMALPRAVQGLLAAGFCPEEIYWGHSAAPVVMRSLEPGAEAGVQRRVQKAATLVSIWYRASDEEAKAYLEGWDGPGELRLHNLLTGNTFMGGQMDEETLADCML